VVGQLRGWQCAAWADFDNDGDLDLMVTDNPLAGEPQPALWLNIGNGRFEDATQAGSFLSDRPWCAPIWGDFNRDGFLDLAVANAWDKPPSEPDWSRNLLYFNGGDGAFRKETEGDFVAYRAGAMIEGGAAGDMDDDGDLDLVLTGGSGRLAWFENDGAGGFRQVTVTLPPMSGTLITPAWADYDNDGRLDVFVAAYSQTSQLLHNDGDGQWTAIPLGHALQTSAGSWADYDNDGDLDLFITRGQTTTTTNLLYANNGDGTFTQVTLGSLANDQGLWAGSAWADYDNNGFRDLFMTSHAGYPEVLYRNHGNDNHWISFKLVGTRSNRSAIGAKVRVQATIFGKTYWQMREVGGGNRHQNDLRPHFGLGDAPRAATVRVEWPSGAVEEFSNLARDQFYTIVEPSLRGAMKPNGEFELSVWASTNRVCTIDYSGDLSAWITLTNFTGQGETPVTYIDTAAPSQNHRFYRMK
jgi:enediyne biosynthesis protein E4